MLLDVFPHTRKVDLDFDACLLEDIPPTDTRKFENLREKSAI